MLTKEDLKKIEEIFSKRFDSIDKRFECMDKRFDSIDKRFDEMEKRLDNIVNIVSLHTEMLKDINLRLISLQGRYERLESSDEEIWSKFAILEARIKAQEGKSQTFNMFMDKGKSSYSKT